MTRKTSATEAQRVIEINTALPFADPIAKGYVVGPAWRDFDHEDALIEDEWRHWKSLGGRMSLETFSEMGGWVGGYTGNTGAIAWAEPVDNGYPLPKSVFERLTGASRTTAILRAFKADGSYTDQPVSLGKVLPDRGSSWVGPMWERAGDGCTCWVNPDPFTYYGTVEPGDALAPDHDCPEHFPAST